MSLSRSRFNEFGCVWGLIVHRERGSVIWQASVIMRSESFVAGKAMHTSPLAA